MSTLGAGGGAILLLPVAGFLMDAREIPPAIAIASVVSSVQRTWIYRSDLVLPIFAANLPGLALGALLGALALRGLPAEGWAVAVGVFLVAYAGLGLAGVRVSLPPARPLHFAAASFVTAALSALVGAAGPLMNPVYLQAGVLKEKMIGTKAVSTLAMQFAKLGSFLALGLLLPSVIVGGLWVGVGALAGNAAGKRALGRISAEAFGRLVRWMLLASGGLMIWRNATA